MGLKQHYGITRRKRLKPYLKFFAFVFIIITISHTFSKYAYTSVNNGMLSIAKWHITINGEEITREKNTLSGNMQLLNVTDNTTNIDSGDECYFDIIINPATTEVAVSYSVFIDLDKSNLPNGTKILKYEKYTNTNENEKLNASTNVNDKKLELSENIILSESQTALDNTSIRRFRIYCKIPFPADINEGNIFVITPDINVKQYIN